jgi:RimJ/RimL family protein N-acetyltransferase
MNLTVREIRQSDIQPLCDYWFNADPNFLISMGVDLDKMVDRKILESRLTYQIEAPYEQKNAYAMIWLFDNVPIGHCNLGNIEYGKQAFMHLHMWNSEFRKKGMGAEFVKKSLPYFFDNIKLQELYCQPFAQNLAPNKTLEKLGFDFLKEYQTVPGAINFEQSVKLWRMSLKKYRRLYKKN